MQETKQTISLEFSQENILVNLNVSENFNTENPIFEELAFYLGALEYNHQKDSASIHLTTLEKLEILCKKAREYADEESEYSNTYKEIRVLVANDKYILESPNSISTEYDNIKLINNNLILVKKDTLLGVLDIKGKEILPNQFDEIYLLSDSIIQTKSKDRLSLYNTDGVLLHVDLEDVIEDFNPFGATQNYFWLKKQGKWGLFDHKLNQIIPFRLEYDSCNLISDNTKENIYIEVTKAGKCGLLNGLLNIEVINLDSEIDNIVLSTNKTYLLTKKNNHKIVLSEDDLLKIEERIKSQN